MFEMIESLSRFNIKRTLDQAIVSIQSPYTYVRDLPKKRVIENLMTMAEQKAPNQFSTSQTGQDSNGGGKVRINVQLRDQLKSNLSEIAETHLEGKTYTPAERANSVRRGTGHWKPTKDKIS